MASRSFHTPQTQGVCHVYQTVTVLPQGSSAAKLGEGDPNGSYFSITRNSAGNLTLKTANPYMAIVGVRVDTQAGYKAKAGLPVQGTDFTWSIPLYTATEGSAVASVGSITAGTGYANSFAVTFTGGGGTGALGVATASGGAIQSVAITSGGFGYTSAPTPVFTAGGGSTGSATAVLATGASADMPVGTSVWVLLTLRNSGVLP